MRGREMEDPGYTSYQDGRLTPPDVADDDAPTPAECWEGCEHGNACRAQLVRLRGRNYGDEENIPGWIDELAAALGCAECELWEADE